MPIWSRIDGPLLFAHRGANREFPEQGADAIRRALELGADVVEIDLQATQDGVFVVSHDSTGERCAGVSRRIADCRWSEIAEWDAGWGFEDGERNHPFRGQGHQFLRFDALLETFGATPFNVDVKGATGDQLKQLILLIREMGAEERVLLTSFSRGRLARIGRLNYAGPKGFSRFDVARLWLSPHWLSRITGYSGKRVQIPIQSGPLRLDHAKFIDRCHHLGLAVDYWVINDVAIAAALLDRGADGIVTDDPRTMAQLFRRSHCTAAWRTRHAALCGTGTD